MFKLPKSGTKPSRVKFVLFAIALFLLGCAGARLLDILAAKIFGWS